MRKQLELLWELQEIDLGLKSIKEEKDRHPKEMKKLDEKQKVERERIEKEKEKIKTSEKHGGRKRDSSLWNRKKSSGQKERRLSEDQ